MRWLWGAALLGAVLIFLGGAAPWVGYSIDEPSTIAAGHSAAGLFHWSGALAFYLGGAGWIMALVATVAPSIYGRRLYFPVLACALIAAAGAIYIFLAWPQVLARESGARSGAELLGFGGDVERFLQEGADAGITMEAGPRIGPWLVLLGAALVVISLIAVRRRALSREPAAVSAS